MNISDSGAKVGDLPPMVLGNGYSGAKMVYLPPMMSGGDIAVSFFAGFMTQWWLDMGAHQTGMKSGDSVPEVVGK